MSLLRTEFCILHKAVSRMIFRSFPPVSPTFIHLVLLCSGISTWLGWTTNHRIPLSSMFLVRVGNQRDSPKSSIAKKNSRNFVAYIYFSLVIQSNISLVLLRRNFADVIKPQIIYYSYSPGRLSLADWPN